MKTPEGKVKDEVKKYLTSISAWHFWPVQTGYGQPALDCIACIPKIIEPKMVGKCFGLFYSFEIKAPGAIPTPRQLSIIAKINRAYGVAAWDDNVDTIKQLINYVA